MTNDIRLWLYPGADPAANPTAWEPFLADISAYIRRPGSDGGAAIQYSAGKQDESTAVDAGQMTLTLDNRDGRFSTDKIDGPWYGLLDTNTPIRLGVVAATDAFTRTTSNGWGVIAPAPLSQSWSVSGTASNWSTDGSRGQVIMPTAGVGSAAIAGNAQCRDADLVTTFTPAAAASGASYGAGHIVRYTDFNNMIYTTVEFNTASTATVKVRQVVGGVTTEIGSLNPIPAFTYSAGNAWKVRTQADGDTIRIKAWPVSGGEPTSWQATATQDSLVGNGIGVITVRFPSNTNSGAVSLIGTDDFTAIGLEWAGGVISWPLQWDMTATNSWAPITAAGILQRLRQGSNPLQSPLRRQLGGTADASGYWPMEEGSDAKFFLSTTPGANSAAFSQMTPGQDTTLAGGGPAPVLSADTGNIVMVVKKGNGGTGFSAMFLVKLPSIPATKTLIARIRTSRGPVPIWDLSVDSSNTYVEAKNGDGTVISSATNVKVEDWTNWIAWQLETDNSGASTAYSAIYHAVGKTAYFAQTGTVAGTTNSVVATMVLTGINGTAFAHAWIGQNTLPFVTDTFANVSYGWTNELAAARFARVCGEAGIPFSVAGAAGLASEAMGAQREGTTMAILQSCADADYGVMAERGAGLEFVPRAARWNATTVMAITLTAGQIADIPKPTRDTQRLRNKWTVSRISGGSGSFQNDASIARNGLWEDSAQLNVFDDSVLENHAAWRVAIGTAIRLRWPNLVLNFARSPELLVFWRQRGYGWRLGVTTGLSQVKGNEPDLVVEGYQATLTPEIWGAELNCTDGRVWTAAVADNTGIYGRVETDGCTSTSSLTATATGAVLPVTTIAGYPPWDNTAGLWSGGVDLNVGGERVTVTAVSAAVGQAQTFTISARGVGGYAAIHPSGTSVSLWSPAPVAL